MFPPVEEMREIKRGLALVQLILKKETSHFQDYLEMKDELIQEQTVAISMTASLYANIIYVITVVALVVILSMVGFFIVHAIRTIRSMSNHMSAETKRQSMHFLRALIAQVRSLLKKEYSCFSQVFIPPS